MENIIIGLNFGGGLGRQLVWIFVCLFKIFLVLFASPEVQTTIETGIQRQLLPPSPEDRRLSMLHMKHLISSGVKRVFNYLALDSGITFLQKQQGRNGFLTGLDKVPHHQPQDQEPFLSHRGSYFKPAHQGRQKEKLFRAP